MLNKFNLDIASLAPKDESRFSLEGVYVTPKQTVVTDGHMLITIDRPDIEPEAIPMIDGFRPTAAFEPFILPAKQALAISKAIPRKLKIPVLNNAFIEAGPGDTAKLAVTDLESPQVFAVKKMIGAYPDFKKVIPNRNFAEITLCLDAKLLVSTLKALIPLATNSNDLAPVVLRIKAPDEAIRIDAKNDDTGQKATAVIMPLKEVGEFYKTHGVKNEAPNVTVSMIDGRVFNIYSDRPISATVASRRYDQQRDSTPWISKTRFTPEDIFETSSMPEDLVKFLVAGEEMKPDPAETEPAPEETIKAGTETEPAPEDKKDSKTAARERATRIQEHREEVIARQRKNASNGTSEARQNIQKDPPATEVPGPRKKSEPAVRAAKETGSRKGGSLSPESREKAAAASRAYWAKVKAEKAANATAA